jgi:hypothetical protein
VTAQRRTTRRTTPRKRAAHVEAAKAKTLVYVHGIGNKPEETVLRCQWDHALLGFGLGERSRMAYWCQADRHGSPEAATCAQADAVGARSLRAPGFGARAIERAVAAEAPLSEVVDELAANEAQRASLMRVLRELDPPATTARGAKRATARAKLLEDVNFFDPLTRLVTSLFLKDVRDFFFDAIRRRQMKARLLERLSAGGGPFVVVAHSLGSVIAYSVLLELEGKVELPRLVTIGSPLGLAEVKDQLRKLHKLDPGCLPIDQRDAAVALEQHVAGPDVAMQEHRRSRRHPMRPDPVVALLQQRCGRHRTAPSFGGAVVDTERAGPVRQGHPRTMLAKHQRQDVPLGRRQRQLRVV